MARFSDLSNEVIVMISKLVRPVDLDSFFMTSKHIREINEAYMNDHSALKWKYKQIARYAIDDSVDKIGSLASLLSTILLAPRAASYVEDFTVRGWHMSWNNDSHHNDWRSEDMLSEQNSILFRDASSASKYVPADQVDEWIDAFRDGSEDQLLVLLLTVLPNLSVLNLQSVPQWNNLMTDTIRRISQDPKPKALTMLKSVIIDGMEKETPLHVVKTLAALPSMRQLHADKVHTSALDKYASPPDSKVTSLRLIRCLVEPEMLYEFLSSFTSLVNFEYTDGTRAEDDAEFGSNDFWICSSLKHHAKHSLKKLTLKSPFRKAPTLIGSLHKFEALEELNVELGALLDSSVINFGLGMSNQVLPSSIRTVTLRHDSAGAGHSAWAPVIYVRILHYFLMQRKRALPHLQALKFRPKKNAKSLKYSMQDVAACEAAGMAVTVS